MWQPAEGPCICIDVHGIIIAALHLGAGWAVQARAGMKLGSSPEILRLHMCVCVLCKAGWAGS